MKMIFWALSLFLTVSAQAEIRRFTIVHTNDIHGWVYPRESFSEKGRMIGGAAALANLVKAERAKGPTLVVDAGDWFQGTPEGTLSRGEMMADVFNAIGYDAAVIGNHEYDLGEAALRALAARFQIPVLGANIRVEATGVRVDYARPFILKEVAGIKVGIFGILTSRMPALSFPANISGLAFEDEISAARAAVAELRRQGAEVVIALTHVGLEHPDDPPFVGDKAIAAAVPGIDVVVGGHTSAPIDRPAPEPSGTTILNTGRYLTRAGTVQVEYDDAAKKVVSLKGGLVKLWIDEFGEDPALKALVDGYGERIGRRLEVVVSTAVKELHRDSERASPAGAWTADCVRSWSKTDLSFQNAGGIRKEISAGPVRLRDLFELMPFDNQLTTLYMSGAAVKAALEHGLGGAPGRLQVSGIEFEFDPKRALGSRLTKALIRGRPLDEGEIYSVSIPDFLAAGGDGYTAFASGTDRVDSGVLIRDVLIWCAKTYSPIRPPDLSRERRL